MGGSSRRKNIHHFGVLGCTCHRKPDFIGKKADCWKSLISRTPSSRQLKRVEHFPESPTSYQPISQCKSITPRCGDILRAYLKRRQQRLARAGNRAGSISTGGGLAYANNRDHEALFHFIPKKEEIGHCSIPIWTMLKKCVETASGWRFRRKDFRPTYFPF